jgi:hypothetical protein
MEPAAGRAGACCKRSPVGMLLLLLLLLLLLSLARWLM